MEVSRLAEQTPNPPMANPSTLGATAGWAARVG